MKAANKRTSKVFLRLSASRARSSSPLRSAPLGAPPPLVRGCLRGRIALLHLALRSKYLHVLEIRFLETSPCALLALLLYVLQPFRKPLALQRSAHVGAPPPYSGRRLRAHVALLHLAFRRKHLHAHTSHRMSYSDSIAMHMQQLRSLHRAAALHHLTLHIVHKCICLTVLNKAMCTCSRYMTEACTSPC